MVNDESFLNCTEEALFDALFPERADNYCGPGAFTASELAERLDLSNHQSARNRARLAVKRGEMVEVAVVRYRKNGGAFQSAAWVLKDIYDEWLQDQVEASKGT